MIYFTLRLFFYLQLILSFLFHISSYLVCTLTHLMALRLTDKNDYAHITVNRPLAAIAKITCKKKHPEFVTFQYGSVTNITDMDRCLLIFYYRKSIYLFRDNLQFFKDNRADVASQKSALSLG